MMAKSLYSNTATLQSPGGGEIMEYTSGEKIPVYTKSTFIGREGGENYSSTRGLTDWVAKNFELLGLGEVPFETRQVNSLTRPRWQQFAMDFLERWMPNHSTRHVIRRNMNGKNGPVYMMFPHPDDALGMNLQGRNGELPGALFDISEEGHILVFAFRGIGNPRIENTDLIATIGINEEDAYEAGGRISAPSDFIAKLKKLKSQIMETEQELQDWFAFLEWTQRMHDSNSWIGEITGVNLVSENPYTAIVNVKSEGRSLHLLKRLPSKRGPKCYITQKISETEQGESLDNSLDQLSNKINIGFVTKAKKDLQPKNKNMVALKVAIRQDIPVTDLQSWVGSQLLNDSVDDYGTLNRERRGLERLRDLEAWSDLHRWIFNIKNAKPGPKVPPELKHPLVDKLNKEQEKAVRSALAAPEVYFIQGPPGTGKTTVIAELINQITADGQRVLVASQTNLAVDNAFSRLKHKTNVRPIRWLGTFAAKDPDPESKPFLEDNVVQSFFLPSIKKECEDAHNAAVNLRSNWQAIEAFNQEGEQIIKQIQALEKEIAKLQSERQKMTIESQNMQNAQQKSEEQLIILRQSLDMINREEWTKIDLSKLIESSSLVKLLSDVNDLELLSQRIPILIEAIDYLSDLDTSGELDPREVELRNMMDSAAADLDFDKAKEIKNQLEELENIKSAKANQGWTSTSKELARFGRKLNVETFTNLASNLQPPAGIDDICAKLSEELEGEVSTITKNLENLPGTKADLLQKIQSRIDNFENVIETVYSPKNEQSLIEIDEKIALANRKRKTSINGYNDLVSALPQKEMLENPNNDESSIIETPNKTYHTKLINAGKRWQKQYQEKYQNENIWFELRNDWIDALNDTTGTSIDDLKSLYLQLVNVHGVTTAQAGSWHWYNEHANDAFDVVIIDEISKAMPTEIILPSLLGKKVIWVGDHRQLAPEFNDPRKVVEDGDDQYNDDSNSGQRFRLMVTTALFERHFIDADPSLKTSLKVQYRMHSQIMDTVNPFYEGNLDCGLDENQQLNNKQHGFSIRKKGSWGLENEGSELIHPRRNVYWVDSAFRRTGEQYCPETKKGTSYFNQREIELAEKILDEINLQVGIWKQEHDVNTWQNHPHLKHIPSGKDKLPVAFITFYLAQKRQFVQKAFAGSSNSTEERWKNLDIKVDTVDRFQGSESPVVIVSMVRSAPIDKKDFSKLKKLLKEQAPSKGWIKNTKANKNQISVQPPWTGFARSPNRVNVAYSRAQNLLIILGNQWAWRGVDVKITRDNKKTEKFRYYEQLLKNTIRGGVLDGRNLL